MFWVQPFWIINEAKGYMQLQKLQCWIWRDLTLVLLNKLRCHAYFQFSANQITWSSLLIQTHILNGKQCRFRSVGFWRSQLIWIYTVCKNRVYPGSAGLGLIKLSLWFLFPCVSFVSKGNILDFYLKVLLYLNEIAMKTEYCLLAYSVAISEMTG